MPNDPWQEEAKNFKSSPHQEGEPTPSGGADDWKIWQEQGGAAKPEGNFLQRGFDKLTTVTPEQEQGTDPVTNQLQKFGAGVVQGFGQPFIHPLDTLGGLANSVAHPIDTANATVQAFKDNPAQSAGNLVGGLGLGAAAGGLARRIPRPERFGGSYKSPVIDPATQNAEGLAKAIGNPSGIPENLIPNIAERTPAMKAYAQKTGNPLHSQAETARAFQGLGDEGLQHFEQNILGPHANDVVNMGSGKPYQGFTGPSLDVPQMTIGEINDRLTAINKLQNPPTTTKNAMTVMSAQERSGLDSEANMLRQKLYTELSKRTGISPEEIKGHREGYGQAYNVGNAIDQSHRMRLGQVGAADEGSTGGLSASKTGLAKDALNAVFRGPREYRANRAMRNALKPFESSPQEFPKPVYPQNNPNPMRGGLDENPLLAKARGLQKAATETYRKK